MDVGLDAERPGVPRPDAAVILLDTNAVIWLDRGHPRMRGLLRLRQRLYVSPATLLEMQFLDDAGRIKVSHAGLRSLRDDHRWLVDEPPAAVWFLRAADETWTRDPFDRLLVGHALLRRWRFATADARILERLGEAHAVAL